MAKHNFRTSTRRDYNELCIERYAIGVKFTRLTRIADIGYLPEEHELVKMSKQMHAVRSAYIKNI
jgi:hypothetical protein